MKGKHPLVRAIELKEKAIRKGADPKIISNLENIVSQEAQKSVSIIGESEYISKVLNGEEDIDIQCMR